MPLVKIEDNTCALVGCQRKLPMYPAHVDLYEKTYLFCNYKCRDIAMETTAMEALELITTVGIGARLAWFSCLKDKDWNRR